MSNLSGVIIDNEFHRNLVEVEKVKEEKAQFMEALRISDFKGYVYLDCIIGDRYHDAVFVGDFGLAARHDADNPVFNELKNVYCLTTLVEICRLRAPIFNRCLDKYRAIIDQNIKEPTSLELIDTESVMDRDAFVASRLWKNIKDCRTILSEKDNIEPFMLFTVTQAFNFLNQFPSTVSESSQLPVEIQELLLDQWRKFLEEE